GGNSDRTVPDGPSADARADQDLDRVPLRVAQGGEGVLDPLQGEAVADQRRRVEDAVGVQPDDPAPGGPGGGEPALDPELAERDHGRGDRRPAGPGEAPQTRPAAPTPHG